MAYQKQGKSAEMKRYFQMVLSANPVDYEGNMAMGACSLMHHNPSAAVSYFTKALSMKPRSELGNFGLAYSYSCLGEVGGVRMVQASHL